jgi:hypothetical protein
MAPRKSTSSFVCCGHEYLVVVLSGRIFVEQNDPIFGDLYAELDQLKEIRKQLTQ